MRKPLFTHTLIAAAMLALFGQAVAEDIATQEVDTVVVSAGSMNRLGVVPFRQAKSAVAVKADTLREEGVEKMDEIGRYQAGFTNQMFGSDSNTNWFKIRGQDASQAIDNNPMISYGFFQPRMESYGVEAVEITKGADSLTFGAAEPGGLINYISKRAHKKQVGRGEIKAHIGNKNQRGLAADYTGGLNAEQSLRYRVVGSYKRADSDMSKTYNESYYFAPTLAWDITDRTKLNVLVSVQKDTGTPSSQFVPMNASLLDQGSRGKVPTSTNFGDPTTDYDRNTQYSVGYDFSHAFGNGITFNSNYRYGHVRNQHLGAYAYSPMHTNDEIARDYVYNNGKIKSHSLDNRVTWRFKHGMFDNTLVGGADYRHNQFDTNYMPFNFPAALSNGNIYNISAVYGIAPAGGYRSNPYHLKAKQLGFYLQNSLKIGKQATVNLGVRHDRAQNDENSPDTGYADSSIKKNHTSYSSSVMYHAGDFNPYVSYNESFKLPNGLNGVGLHKPQLTKQTEIGVKYVPRNYDVNASLALFSAKDSGRITYTQATGTFSNDNDYKRKGVELQVGGHLSDNWSGSLAYTHLNAKTVLPSGSEHYTARLPKNSLALQTHYHFDRGMLNGLTVGGGVRHIGSSVGSTQWATYPAIKVPSATLFDLSARYSFANNWTAQLNVHNLADKTYVASCDTYCYYGERRRVNASLSYQF